MDIPKDINAGNNGGLKFIVQYNGIKLFSCYRVTFEGGLDYCNNNSDKMYLDNKIPKDAILEMIVSAKGRERSWYERYRGKRNGYENIFEG